MRFIDSLHLYSHIIKSGKRAVEDYNKQSLNRYGQFTLYNWWQSGTFLWFVNRYNEKLERIGKTINLCSVFGERAVLDHISGIKVFFCGENVHNSPYDEYSDYLLRDRTTGLGLGFEFFEDKRYLRFPLWVLYMFSPSSSYADVVARCRELRYPKVSDKSLFCSMVASHDWNGLRKIMVTELGEISDICCPGKYLHNDDSLKNQYNDDKTAYLRDFYFNICPENSNSCGYVTEKVFEAIDSGCIPIYWGSYNNPEPQVLNGEAILFWQEGRDNQDIIREVSHLYSCPGELDEFLHLPRLADGAEDHIWTLFEDLDRAINDLIAT